MWHSPLLKHNVSRKENIRKNPISTCQENGKKKKGGLNRFLTIMKLCFLHRWSLFIRMVFATLIFKVIFLRNTAYSQEKIEKFFMFCTPKVCNKCSITLICNLLEKLKFLFSVRFTVRFSVRFTVRFPPFYCPFYYHLS